tara:strand:+ start:325 stop:486 length:162 start_codon:yes stop_codon:yes gene_type:complete
MTFKPKSEPLTDEDIKEVSTNYLRYVSKNSNNNQLIIKCLKEISRRNTRRPIN